MTAGWQVRRLVEADAPVYRALRLAGLAAHPQAFGSSWEEEAAYDDTVWRQRVAPPPPNVSLGGFVDGRLAGIAGIIVSPRLKQQHKGTVVGVYVEPAARGSGLSRGLLAFLITEARASGLLLLQLAVSAGNVPARRLYAAHGFRPYGIEPRALRIDGRFVDDELMMLDLDRGCPASSPPA